MTTITGNTQAAEQAQVRAAVGRCRRNDGYRRTVRMHERQQRQRRGRPCHARRADAANRRQDGRRGLRSHELGGDPGRGRRPGADLLRLGLGRHGRDGQAMVGLHPSLHAGQLRHRHRLCARRRRQRAEDPHRPGGRHRRHHRPVLGHGRLDDQVPGSRRAVRAKLGRQAAQLQVPGHRRRPRDLRRHAAHGPERGPFPDPQPLAGLLQGPLGRHVGLGCPRR